MSADLWWSLARATGIVAYATLTLSVLLGAVLASRAGTPRLRSWLADLHRWLAGLTAFFIGGHLTALVADSSVNFGAVELFVPFASQWKPAAVAAGVVAFWLLLAVQATSMALKRLPRSTWRLVHVFGYVAFWLTSVHGAVSGSDSSQAVYLAGSLVATLAVLVAVSLRVLARPRPARPPSGGGVVGTRDESVASDARRRTGARLLDERT